MGRRKKSDDGLIVASLPDPCVMGILNVTPDSFSDGGRYSDLDNARQQAERMAAEGAAIIDIGGESTRPGAADVDADSELQRVIPVVEAVVAATGLPVSVDTSKASVMRAAVSAGASMINDVLALRGDCAVEAVAELGVPVCLMHMQGRPRTMQQAPTYRNVTDEVEKFLRKRIDVCLAAGIARESLLVDPGFGFGKSHRHNVELLANLRQLADIGPPLLVGLSRKSTLGELTGRGVDDRKAASVAAATVASLRGARIIRAHDVRETLDAIRVASAVAGCEWTIGMDDLHGQ